MGRFIQLFLPSMHPANYREKALYITFPTCTWIHINEPGFMKAARHPRDHVPLGKPSTRYFCPQWSFVDSIHTDPRYPLSEIDPLFGGLSWASSQQLSLLQPA